MDSASKRSGSITFLLVGLVLLVLAAGFGFFCVPFLVCPCCHGHEFHVNTQSRTSAEVGFVEAFDCTVCKKGKVTAFKKWLRQSEPDQGGNIRVTVGSGVERKPVEKR